MRSRRRKNGQSTLEYILVIAAILVVVILAATQFISPAVSNTMSQAGTTINGAVTQLGTRVR